jgi:hypothetical protein
LRSDNEDLQHEFESDRQGYLNTIRSQEKQLLLYRTMLEKMSNIMEHNCNYSNIDKIMEKARYDEERNVYYVPDPIREEVQFPQVGNLPTTTTRVLQNEFISSNNSRNNQISHMDSDELERRYGRNIDVLNVPTGKNRNKRQEQLLNENALLQSTKMRTSQTNNIENDHMNRRLNPFEAPTRLTGKYGVPSNKQ